ncbi:MAG: restriction endonuclease subunit S [Methylomonas sp.]|jgi:type I restriction enzyme S subunit|uniref:restriction endonuclease subunit S n=1 Tax=Methylomonas sp. TaxID=418 RepID=UPI0025DADD74|nr:restriction endonuclease subunit S [Methylomonas sp.]MCK9607657.1 restriction endonuclease subunit S [Methylomonas sp.]
MTDLISQHLDLWTTAIVSKSRAGRGNKSPSPAGEGRGEGNPTSTRNAKYTAYGIKKLRELILELAVRGKLVPQDPNDESANDLLNQINDVKNKLVCAGEIKTQKPLDEIGFDEMTFELPHGWKWCRLGEICEFVNGYAFKSSDFTDQGIGVVKIGDIQNGEIVTESMSRVNKSIADELVDSFIVKSGEMVIAMSGATTGKLGFNSTDEIFYLNQRVGKISPFICYSRFLYYPLTTKIQENLAKSMGSAIPNLSTAQIKDIVLALPPLAEQHRIVAKVDELMALCDQLEQQQTDSIAAHQTLVQTLLDALIARDGVYAGNAGAISGNQAADNAEFEQTWSRIADHFDTLFTTEHSIDQLKQTLLQLAVMGKLVPQDPNDQVASILIENVAHEKSELIKEGVLKNQKPLPPVSEEEIIFELPVGWAWTRLNNLSLHSEAGWSPNCESTPRVCENWGVLKVSAVTWGKFNPEENKALPKALEPKPEYEIMAGDFLISRANTAELVARAVIVPENPPRHLMMSDKIIRFVFSNKVSAEFINLVNSSDYSRNYYSKVAGGTSSSMKNVSREQIRMLVIALPPLAEQHRIVAKVDELMAICDTLKARITEAQTTQLQLADAIVEQAVA